MKVVSRIVRKKFITEMDLLRLRGALMGARMAADSTFLVRQDRALVFRANSSAAGTAHRAMRGAGAQDPLLLGMDDDAQSRSSRILRDLQARLSPARRLGAAEASASSSYTEFQRDPTCRVFLTTNAGSTGLNLQAADTVINVDLPWNPAVLEQRIARRIAWGRSRKVQVYLLVTERTIEENLLATLGAKHELAPPCSTWIPSSPRCSSSPAPRS